MIILIFFPSQYGRFHRLKHPNPFIEDDSEEIASVAYRYNHPSSSSLLYFGFFQLSQVLSQGWRGDGSEV